jgi:hypothetical protein
MNGATTSMRHFSDTGDQDIRNSLRAFVLQEHTAVSDALLLEEFSLYGGEIRADLAVLNGCSHAYEIKSGRDTLKRLPHQIKAYSDIFERATLVTTPCHMASARSIVPRWWGLIRATRRRDGICLIRVRHSRWNPSLDARAIASLLWRAEALHLLNELGLDSGLRSRNMMELIARLSVAVPVERLADLVRQAIRARGDWQAAARRKRCDDTYQPHANLWGCRRILRGSRHR